MLLLLPAACAAKGDSAQTATASPPFLQSRREERMESMLDTLKAVCAELGEDDKAAAAEVHESLVYLW